MGFRRDRCKVVFLFAQIISGCPLLALSGIGLLRCKCPVMTHSGHMQTHSKCYASYVLCVRAGDGHEAAGIYQVYR
jgi:hypothetical protein